MSAPSAESCAADAMGTMHQEDATTTVLRLWRSITEKMVEIWQNKSSSGFWLWRNMFQDLSWSTFAVISVMWLDIYREHFIKTYGTVWFFRASTYAEIQLLKQVLDKHVYPWAARNIMFTVFPIIASKAGMGHLRWSQAAYNMRRFLFGNFGCKNSKSHSI